MTGLWERAIASVLILFGVVIAYAAGSYGIGSLSETGAGYFPRLVGILLAIVGVFNLAACWQSDGDGLHIPWRSFLLVILGILAWTVLVERVGMVPASFVLVTLATIARPPVNPVHLIVTAVTCSLLAALIFIYGFALPLKLFTW